MIKYLFKSRTRVFYLSSLVVKNRVFQFVRRMLLRFLLLPASWQKILWDLILIITLLISAILIPFEIAFLKDVESEYQKNPLYFLVPYVIYFIDMILQMRLAYYDNGTLVRDSYLIVKYYINNYLAVDAIVVSSGLFAILANNRYLEAFFLLQIIKIMRIINEYEDRFFWQNRNQAYYDLFKLFIFIMFVIHYLGCLFFLVTQLQGSGEETWVDRQNIANSGLRTKYIFSLYWATITGLTIGYGDIVPQTEFEKVFVILISILTSGLFAYILSKVGTILHNLQERTKEYRSRMT